MQIEGDTAALSFSLSESEKDGTNHETKAGVEISHCNVWLSDWLAQTTELSRSKVKLILADTNSNSKKW